MSVDVPPGGSTRLGRASGVMALGTIASRATGFLRTVAIAVAVGTGAVGDAYNVANTTPNIIYDLLLGGVLTSVVVPVLVRASKEDPDGGEDFARSLLTLVGLGLAAATLIGLVAAPLIVRLYLAGASAERDLATTFLRYFVPQVLFYGLGATIGAILNVRGRFAAPMATPVLNNLVVIATAVVFVLLPGRRPPTTSSMTTTQTTVLAVGTTLGVVVMTLALLPSLRAAGFRYRPRLNLRHPALRQAGRLAGWVLVYVAVSQVGYFVVTRLATGTIAYTTYTYAYQLFQLPHAIVAVSVITALLPRMSGHAADQRLDLVRDDLSTGLRMAAVVLVPAAIGLLVLAHPLSVAVFAHGAVSLTGANRIGAALAAFAVALLPFSAFQLQLRAFYALADSRTPALVMCGVVATNILTANLLALALPDNQRAVALALSFALSYLVGAAICFVLLARRLPGVDGARILQTCIRAGVASVLAGAVAFGVAVLVRSLLGTGPAGSLVAVLAAALLGGAVYLLAALRMTTELRAVATVVARRLNRG